MRSHNNTMPSSLPVATVCPSGLKETLLTTDVCPVRVRRGLPRVHIPKYAPCCPQLPVAERLPIWTKRHAYDPTRMPRERPEANPRRVHIPNTNRVVPTPTCQGLTPPDLKEDAIDPTRMPCERPEEAPPVFTSQRRTVLSKPPLARVLTLRT